MVILDTNIIIDHLRQPDRSILLSFLNRQPQSEIFISTITIQELYIGQSTKNPAKEEMLQNIVNPLHLIPLTFPIAKLAGILIRDTQKPLTFADAAIAATAITNHLPLLTLNSKDFTSIPDLKLCPLP